MNKTESWRRNFMCRFQYIAIFAFISKSLPECKAMICHLHLFEMASEYINLHAWLMMIYLVYRSEKKKSGIEEYSCINTQMFINVL